MTDAAPAGMAAPEASVPEQRTAPQEPAPVTTPGGIPGVPALTIGASSALTAVSTAGLAGGPLGAVLTAGGLAATAAAVAVARSSRIGSTTARSTAKPTPKATSSRAAQGAGGYRPAGRMLGGQRSGGGRAAGAGGALRKGAGAGALRAAGVGGRVGQIRAARAAAAAAPTGRRERREALTADRRRVADTRRAARAASAGASTARRGQTAPGGGTRRASAYLAKGTQKPAQRPAQRPAGGATGRVGRLMRAAGRMAARAGGSAVRTGKSLAGRLPGGKGGKGAKTGGKGTAASAQGRSRAARRAARDAKRAQRVAQRRARIAQRSRVRTRQAALRRAAARFHARRVGAVLAAVPLGLLSLLMWPIARLLRIPAPHWGRRVYRYLIGAATQARAHAVVQAHKEHQDAEAAAAQLDREQLPEPDRAAPTGAPATIPATKETVAMTNPNSFDFRAAAEEMLRQAQTAEPGGMMHVLASFESLPETLGLIAETFAVVASRCSEEMPLDPSVGDALQEVNKALLGSVEGAAEVARVFTSVHEPDIRRHVDPRPGEEAWDTTANSDHTAQSQG
ncbi:hypothetical protein [Streptomyces goshikiensis]|uniref:hypothetical protein n=1 Tax=Streptomyces goshikiensis TaxID=1942 RepID=UPI00364DE182